MLTPKCASAIFVDPQTARAALETLSADYGFVPPAKSMKALSQFNAASVRIFRLLSSL